MILSTNKYVKKEITMDKVILSPPWITYFRDLDELFSEDNEVSVVYDHEKMRIRLLVTNSEKANALSRLLKPERKFGNATLTVEVCYANSDEKTPMFDLMRVAFKNNPVCSKMSTAIDLFGNVSNYVAFKPEVAQFFNDDLSDLNGNKSLLYKDIAEDVFSDHDGIFFCTDKKEN